MKKGILKITMLSLYFVFTIANVYAQEVKTETRFDYIKKIEAEGFEIVTQGSLNEGSLSSNEFPMEFKAGYQYLICVVPKGKLKKRKLIVVFEHATLIGFNTQDNPVIYSTYKCFSTKSGEVYLRASKRGKFKRFELSSKDSLYYIIGKKPFKM